ncbi:MAG: RNA methyltransferase [Candidatus Sulfotelmatobacter sp.]
MPLFDLNRLVVVLVRPRNPLNIGAAARAMTNFGARTLRVVNPYEVAFRDARSAVGASSILKNAQDFQSVAEAVEDCSLVVGTTAVRHRALNQPAKQLGDESSALIRNRLADSRAAILFGSEKTGLSNDDFSHCHWLITIPTHKENISLNLGQAVAVCLYELARAALLEEPKDVTEPATAARTEQITECLLEALNISGYIKPGTEKMFEKKTRQLILRFNLEAYDAKLLLGMVRQIIWKLRLPEKC